MAGGVAAVRGYAPSATPLRFPVQAAQAGKAAGRGYYAAPAPTGSRSGDGSRRRPWDLATALAGGVGANKVGPGDTIWVQAGVHRGPFRSTVAGREGAPVVVRAVPGERAVIDGRGSRSSTLTVRGDFTIVWGLELTNSDTTRTVAIVSHDARPNAVVNNASHTKYINLIIHDAGTAIYAEPAFVDVEIAGCILYNNGWQAPDRGHGHGLYLKSLTGPLIARDNVIFNQYGYGVHVYSNASTGKLINIRIEGNISFNNGTLSSDRTAPNILLGGEAYATADVVKDNITYFPAALSGANVRIGYKKVLNGDVQVEGNLFVGGSPVIDFGFWQAAAVSGNTLIGSASFITRNQSSGPGHIFRGNTEERRPTGLRVVTRPNPHEPGRAHVAVFNWDRQSTVELDLTGVLAPGDRYEVWNVQDLFGTAVARGTYDGAPVTVSMLGVAPPAPIGVRASRAPQTAPEFQAFLVRRVPAPPSS
jgi:hypothetical protein